VEVITRQIDPVELILEGADFAGMPFTVEMAETIEPYVNAVNELIAQGYEWFLEQRVSAPAIHEECEGTADLQAYLESEGHLMIGDLKTGWEDVQPDSYQLAIYLEGARRELEDQGRPVFKMTAAIVQPLDRDEPVKLKHYTPAELKKVVTTLRKATQGKAAAAGDWCKYCPHAAVCDTLAEHSEAAISGASMDESHVQTLTGERVAEILDRQAAVGIWFKAVANYANVLLSSGEKVPGWGLKEGLSDRFWKDKEAAESQLHAVYGDDIYEPQVKILRSAAQIEKIWPNSKPLVKTLTDRASTGVKLKKEKDDE
jgi:hypothetical protein